MISSQRIFWSDNGTLTDLSIALNNYRKSSEVIPLVTAEDYLYLGSNLPFNHRYIDVAVANDQAATPTVEIWNGQVWEPAVDIIDQTAVSGVPLAASGLLRWTTEKDTYWGEESTTEDIPELATLRIYDFYWVRISYSATLNVATALNYLGHKFSDDDDLGTEYPDLVQAAVYDAYETGKTNWDEQTIRAAEEIVDYLVKNKKIVSGNQVLSPYDFNAASVHKTAQIIMNAFGNDFQDIRERAKNAYLAAMNNTAFDLDRNADGIKDKVETFHKTGLFRR